MMKQMRLLLAAVGIMLMAASAITTIATVTADDSAETPAETTAEAVETSTQESEVQPIETTVDGASIQSTVEFTDPAVVVSPVSATDVVDPAIVQPTAEVVVIETTPEVQPKLEVTAEVIVPVEVTPQVVTTAVIPATQEQIVVSVPGVVGGAPVSGAPVNPTQASSAPIVPTELAPVDGGLVTPEVINPVIEVTVIPPVDPALMTPTQDSSQVIEVTPMSEVPVAAVTAEAPQTVVNPAQVSGELLFPGFETLPVTVLTLTLPDSTTAETVTDEAGRFSFTGLQAGNYRLEAKATGFLATNIEFTLSEGQVMALPVATLRSGDVNQDNVINIQDAVLVAANFDGPANMPGIDLTQDGWIDIRDLSLIGAQYGSEGPSAWN